MDRQRRAFVLMGLASVAAVIVIGIFLRSGSSQARAAHPAPQPSVQPWQIASVSFGDVRHGAITMAGDGHNATFLTADGGRSWRTYSTRPGVTTFLDGTHAVSVDLSQAGAFGVSDDAGRTWQTGSQPIPLAGAPVEIEPGPGLVGGPFFLDPSDGWWIGSLPVTGQPVLCRTRDGGRTWSNLTPAGVVSDPETSLQIQTVFVDALHGALVVGPERPGAWPSVLVTHDGGQTWAPVEPSWPLASMAPDRSSVVVPTLIANRSRLVLELDVVAGQSQKPSTVRGHVLSVSDDGGLTWGPWATMPSTSTYGAGMAIGGAGTFLLADDRRLWTSSDLGRTWHSQPVTGLAGHLLSLVAAPDGSLFGVARPGSAGAAAVTLARSQDGGRRWTAIHVPPKPKG